MRHMTQTTLVCGKVRLNLRDHYLTVVVQAYLQDNFLFSRRHNQGTYYHVDAWSKKKEGVGRGRG